MKHATIILCAFETKIIYGMPYEDLGSPLKNLEYVFRQGNRVDGTEYIAKRNLSVRSISVGDIVILEGEYFICDSCGWVHVDPATAIIWQQQPSRDISCGWDWTFKQAEGDLPAPITKLI